MPKRKSICGWFYGIQKQWVNVDFCSKLKKNTNSSVHHSPNILLKACPGGI